MPSGAKKRKALKKKELEAFGASPSNKGVNGHGTVFFFKSTTSSYYLVE